VPATITSVRLAGSASAMLVLLALPHDRRQNGSAACAA